MSTEIYLAEIEYGQLQNYIGKSATVYISGEEDGEKVEVVTAGVIEMIQIRGTQIGVVLASGVGKPAHLTADTSIHVVKLITEVRKTRR